MNQSSNFRLALLSFFIVTVLWALSARLSGWSENVFPGPLKVLSSMMELAANGSLFRHAAASLYRVTVGFYLAIALGIPLGVILGRVRFLADIINPLIHFLKPISPLAWIPLAMIWFGIGDQPAIFLIFLSSFFPITVSTTIAVSNINPVYFQVAANFDFSRFEVLRRVVFPAIVPSVITALRLTITIAWLVVVAAEMIAVQTGLGYLILDSRNALRMDYVMDAMIVIGIIGLFLDYIMKKLGNIKPASWGKFLQ